MFIPAFFLIALAVSVTLGPRFGPAPLDVLGWAFALLLLPYHLLLTRAVFLCARRTPEVVGWRWVGVAITFLGLLTNLGMLLILYARAF